jgi:glycosyltransferase involved in cell wall biosynthesis
MRILHVNNQASVAYIISRYQRKLGHDSDLLARPNPYQHPPDMAAGSMADLYLKLLRKAPRYELIHVHGGMGISGLGLLPYKALGKRFFAHYHGSELRKGIQTSFHSIAEKLFISTPDLKRYSKNVGGRELVHIPNPVPLENVRQVNWEAAMGHLEEGSPLRIAHLPTVRATKGTDNVIKAFEEAKMQVPNLELDIIEDVTTEDAMKRLEKAHICIDWMSPVFDIHGVVSLEAMVRRIPVICNIDRSLYPSDIPIIATKPQDLAETLVRIAGRISDLPGIGDSSRRYVLQYHHPMEVAKKLERYL